MGAPRERCSLFGEHMFDIKGKVAIVTGGSQGIGYELARTLASAGAITVIANRNAAKGKAAEEAFKAEGLPVEFFQADISSQESIDALFAHVMEKYGKLDICVNNAAVIKHRLADEQTPEDWDMMADVNLRGTYFCCVAAHRCMKGHGGRIINIGSVTGVATTPGRSIYGITKAGIHQMTRYFAREWGADGVTINVLGPGLTITELNRKHYEDNPDDLDRIVKKIPLGRVGECSDYAGPLLFMASDASSYMTGQIIFIDGGVSFA